jgi:hypothetical protein
MIATMTTEVTHEDKLFDHLLIAGAGAAYAETIVRYKERLGISVLRKPAAGTQSDNCIVYKPLFTDGALSGYKPVEVNNQPSTLASVIAKGFLLTPMGKQDEPLAEPAKVEDVVSAERSVETHSDESEEQSSSASPTETFVCERKFANNKTCGKEYKAEKYYLAHIRNKHAS